MKARNGFVSNSSSTSFTCDVCGEDVSGWDLCISDSGMCQCQNGHTFCEEHQRSGVEELTIDQKREILVASAQRVKISDYWTVEKRNEEVQRMKNLSEDEVEDTYSDFEVDVGVDSRYCPICQFEKPNVPDLFKYLVKKCASPAEVILAEVKDEFTTYREFKKYIDAP
jgi:hypothetical protein